MENPYITEVCPVCNGIGKTAAKLVWMGDHECYTCQGVGKIPNEAGMHILSLVNIFVTRKGLYR